MRTLTFRTEIQKMLFTQEIQGQLSDGFWENTRPYDHWEVWCECEVKVGENVGRDFWAQKDNYNLVNKDLLDVVGDRMVDLIRIHKAFPNLSTEECSLLSEYNISDLKRYAKSGSNTAYWQEKLEKYLSLAPEEEIQKALNTNSAYSMKDLRKDLREMKQTMKTKIRCQ